MRYSGLFLLAVSLFAMMTINFFVTDNPYAAIRGGKAAYDAATSSTEFRIHVNSIVLVCLFLACFIANKGKLVIPVVVLVWGCLVMVSGLENGVIFLRPQSYFFYVSTFFLTFSLALIDLRGLTERAISNVFALVFIMSLFGVVLALLRPNVWGYLPFTFSRDFRGDNVMASIVAAYLLIPAVFASTYFAPAWLRWSAFVFISIVALSVATRTFIILMFMPLLVVAAARMRGGARFFALIAAAAAFTFAWPWLYDTFVIDVSSSSLLEGSLTGRLPLWQFYWRAFEAAPLFGQGSFLLERAISYEGDAVSEIGVLKTFSEYGVLVGGLQMLAILAGVYASVQILFGEQRDRPLVFFGLIVICWAPFAIMQDSSRIQNFTDFIFWYSVFFVTCSAWPRMRLSIAFKSADASSGMR